MVTATPVPTLAALFLFGSIVVAYAVYKVYRYVKPASSSATAFTPNPKSEGLVEGEYSVAQLGRAGFELGLLLLFTWLCENRPVFPHGDKIHDFDFFYLICFTALLVALLFTVHKAPQDLGVLNREQSEEWKGMMQLVFLLYHQFALEETYPLIRLFISCYVFLTGFGNASFFYLKRDYSLVRVLSMLWRLLFACLVLAMTHDNPIILYYIVPLHTFYFLVSYVTMGALEHRINYERHGLKIKLALLGVAMFVVWEFPPVFDLVFSFLSNKPNPGAAVGAYGTRYEWQFRSGLDHYSSLFGMIFACSFPMMEARVSNGLQANKYVFAAVSVLMFSFIAYWTLFLFPLNKYVYNAQHAYVFVFPLIAYLFFRNCTAYLRRVHLGLFAYAGKYTLETYLLQHHIWLTSNAKTVLVLVPGLPKLNFLLVSAIYFILSVKLFDLTVKLKFLLIPSNNRAAALKGLFFLAGAVGASFSLAFLARVAQSGALLNSALVVALALVWLALGAFRTAAANLEKMWLFLSLVFVVLGFIVALTMGGGDNAVGVSCDANEGAWVQELAWQCKESPASHYAYCESRGWAWDVSAQKQCGWKRATDVKDFDRILLWSSTGSNDALALALARVEDATFARKELPASSKIKLVGLDSTAAEEITEKTMVLCLDAATHARCMQLNTGVALLVLEEGDTVPAQQALGKAAALINAAHVKQTASAQDVLARGEYRAHVHDVIAQIAVNQARRMRKMRAPALPAPTAPSGGGGLAHNPVYGVLFLSLAFFAMVMGDGYLGLVAVFGRVFGTREQQVTWEAAVEKVHAQVPGLLEKKESAAATTGDVAGILEAGGGKREKSQDHLSDVEEAVDLVAKS